MSPIISEYFAGESIRYAFRMRYQGNTLRVWFGREDVAAACITPLVEAPVPKDRWISPDSEVMTYPPMPTEFVENSDDISSYSILHSLQQTTTECRFHRDLWTERMLAYKIT
jgi:hypothetical protein